MEKTKSSVIRRVLAIMDNPNDDSLRVLAIVRSKESGMKFTAADVAFVKI